MTEAPQDYYDPVTGRPLFRAPVGRSREDFLAESKAHGWPSFRDAEVYWDNVRVLRDPNGSMAWRPTECLGRSTPRRRTHRLISTQARPYLLTART